MRLMDSLRKIAVIGIFHSRWEYELVRHPETGKALEFGSYQAAHDYIERHGLPQQASPIELYADR